MHVSALGFGAWAVGGHGYGQVDEKASIEAVRGALDLGITLFDTADVYGFGESERLLKRALGADRHRVVVATKFGMAWDAAGRTWRDASPARIVAALDASLERLGLDCIPLYQVHWPDGVTPLEEILEVLDRCIEAGKVGRVGVSNFSPAMLAGSVGRVASVQYLLNLVEREREADAAACHREMGMAVLAYSVLVRGLFSGKFSKPMEFGPGDTRSRDPNFQEPRLSRMLAVVDRIAEMARKYSRTPGQVAIRWVLDHPDVTCAIVGAKRVDQVVENVGALDWRLVPDDWEELARLGAWINTPLEA